MCSLVFVAACGNNGGSGTPDGGNGDGGGGGGGNFAVVSATVTLAPGADCETGGVRVDIGLDNGDGGGVARDGTLQTGEVDTSKVICNPANPTFMTVTQSTPLSLGNVDCPFGGTKISYGLDNGDGGGIANDGVLQMGEIDGSSNACLSMAASLLAETTPLFAGDPDCAYGGQLLKSGFDDGTPTGTANNGKLEPDEVDFQQRRCNAAPDVTFPAPTGPDGLARIDARGGNSQGSGSSVGGRGGRINVAAYGGPLPTAVEVYRKGSVTPDTTTTKPTFTPGTHTVTITSDTTIPVVGDASETDSTLYILRGATDAVAWPLYDDGALVTSLDVAAGATLKFSTTFLDVRVSVSGDVRNAGTIRAVTNVEGNDYAVGLTIECHTLLNEATGVIDQRAVLGTNSANVLVVWAVLGSGGQIYNEGALRTDGRDFDASETGAVSADIFLTAAGTIFNSGKIYTRGSRADYDTGGQAYGSMIWMRTLAGDLVNTGELDSSGGRGFSSNGGSIFLFNGPTPSGPDVVTHPILTDGQAYGPGGFTGTGTIRANGGSTESTAGLGEGGTVVIRMLGKRIVSNQLIDARGGGYTGTASANTMGSGGRIFIGAYTFAGTMGERPPVVPSGILLGPPAGATDPEKGSLLASGGEAAAGDAYAGHGGQIDVILDLTLSGRGQIIDQPSRGRSEPYVIVQTFDRAALAALEQQARVQLVGFGGNVLANGGSSPRDGHGGGLITFVNAACVDETETTPCAYAHLGARLITNETELHVEGGEGTTSLSGAGGGVSFRIAANNSVPAALDPAQIASAGPIYGRTGDSVYGYDYSPYDLLQTASFTCDSCEVSVTGPVDLRAGDAGAPGYASSGGTLVVSAFGATIDADVALSGGKGGAASGGGGLLAITAYRVATSGTIDASGSNGGVLSVDAALSLTNSGTLVCDGKNGPTNGAAGGLIQFRTPSITNTGVVAARGEGEGEIATGGLGGAIRFRALAFVNDGTVDASGGFAGAPTSATGGSGGSITFEQGGVSGVGSLTARGGDATTSSSDAVAGGGSGGTVSLAGDNGNAIEVSGGDATKAGNASGGTGGVVNVGGNNSAAIRATGGTSTSNTDGGDGGTVAIAGVNTACIDVSGTDGGAAGTIDPVDLPNFCE